MSGGGRGGEWRVSGGVSRSVCGVGVNVLVR